MTGLENTRYLNSVLLGSEYILDFSVKKPDSSSVTRRVHLLRPFTKVEALSMPPATEQRGIHLVLPVLR